MFESDDIEVQDPVHSIEDTEEEGEDVGGRAVQVRLELVEDDLGEILSTLGGGNYEQNEQIENYFNISSIIIAQLLVCWPSPLHREEIILSQPTG